MANGIVRKRKSDISTFSVSIISKAFGMLSNQLLALAEDKEQWSEISERVRQGILVKLKPKKPKQIRDRKKK
jgi:hypothetical protein